MIMFKATRFLLQKIDARLGDVRKEIKFDKITIGVCTALIVLEIILLALSNAFPYLVVPAIVGAFIAAICVFILPAMIKELSDDQKKLNA